MNWSPVIALLVAVGAMLNVSCSSTKPTTAARTGASLKKENKVYSAPMAGAERLKSTGWYRKVRTTAYCHTEADSLKYGRASAISANLRFDKVRSAAADWSVYPVGTIFRIVGEPYIYRIDDYGSALVGTGTIDLYRPNQSAMRAWGVRHVDIEILRWGCLHKSHEILEPRTKHSHVRSMVAGIKRKIAHPGRAHLGYVNAR